MPEQTMTGAISGKRRNFIRRAKDKAEAKHILKTLIHDLESTGDKAIDVSTKSFND